jgi:hypothetical protein
MKTLLWKELRQLAPWGALMWLAAVVSTIGVLVEEFDGMRDARIFADSAFVLVALGSAGVALALGILQTVLEVRRDQWAFLLHRGLTATQVFLGKAAAGMSVYAAVTLTSVFLCVVWVRGGGVECYPFSWYQTLPMLAAVMVAPAFYFAAMLTVVWKGPFYVSRLLPLAAPCLMFTGVLAIVFEVTEYVPFFIIAAIAAVVALFAVAAWGVFVRSGEAAGRTRRTTICLAIPTYVAIASVTAGMIALTATLYEWSLDEVFERDRWSHFVRTGYTANREGHVVQVVYGPGPIHNRWDMQILSVTNLDAPGDKRYGALVGKPLSLLNTPEKVPEWDPLPASSIWFRYDHPLGGMFGRGGRTTVLEDLGLTGAAQRPIHWIYSSADGWIYGYVTEFEMRDGRRRQKPPRLIHVVGPDGFTDAAHRPARRFGQVLASSANTYRGYTWVAWPELARGGSHPPKEFFILCVDGVFVVDFDQHEVRQELVAREGRRIRSLNSIDDGIAVVYDDAVSVHAANIVPFGTARNWATGDEEPTSVRLPGELRYSFPLPDAITRFERFQMGIMPDREAVVFRADGISSLGSQTRFVTMKLDGTQLQSRDFPNDERLPADALPIMCGTALIVPLCPLVLGLGFDAIGQLAQDTGHGSLVWMLRQYPAETILLLAALFAGASFSRWSAGRTARRYGFDAPTRRAWQWTAFLLGPVGLVTLWLLRDWPALETCSVCSHRRPVDRETCPHCAQPAPRPLTNGTEIIVYGSTEPVGVLSS